MNKLFKRGFTLVEMMVAIAILAISAMIIYSSNSSAIRHQLMLEEITIGHWLLLNEIETEKIRRTLSPETESDKLIEKQVGLGERRYTITRNPIEIDSESIFMVEYSIERIDTDQGDYLIDRITDHDAQERMKTSGFTLIEMLVTLAMFAMIGLVSSQLLYQTANLSVTMVGRSDYVTDVHRAMSVIDRDMRQIVNRGIRDELGLLTDPLTLDDGRLFQFSRMGWLNPFDESRGNVQRVEYIIDEGTLKRRYWYTLDRVQEAVAVTQTVLEGVEMRFVLIDSDGDSFTTFPELLDLEELLPEVEDPNAAEEEAYPVAIQFEFALPDVGTFNRVWMIPSVPNMPEADDGETDGGNNPTASGS